MYLNFGGVDPDEESALFLQQLAKAAGFGEADLADNRLGRLSTAQMLRLITRVVSPLAGLAVSATGLVLATAGLALGAEFIVSKLPFLLPFRHYLSMGLGVLFLGLFGFVVRLYLVSARTFQLLLDLMDGKVLLITGRVTTSRSMELEDGLINKLLNWGSGTFSLVVKGKYFEVNAQTNRVMLERTGSNFRLYVTARSCYVVGIDFAEETSADSFRFRSGAGETAA